jgi:ribosomal protein S4
MRRGQRTASRIRFGKRAKHLRVAEAQRDGKPARAGLTFRRARATDRDRLALLSETLRIDKWLFHARFCKTRTIAQEKAEAGRIRLNGQRVEKASAMCASAMCSRCRSVAR